MVKVSVVIPCYNAEEFIGEALESVFNQTYRPYEVIVVDDGSTDSSVKIVKKFGNKVKLIQQANKGRVKARKVGFRYATGDWIALLDADDYWHPEKLEKQVCCLLNSPDDIVLIHGKDQWVGPDNLKSSRIYISNRPTYTDFKILFQKNFIATSSVLLKRSVLNQIIDFWNLGRHRAQDYGLWLLMLCHGRAFYIDQVVSYYRIHDYDFKEQLRFIIGGLAARKNVISYIKQKRLYHLLKEFKWKEVISNNCFNIFWFYYSNQEYPAARKYLLQGLKYSFSLRYLLYLCFLSIFPDPIISTIRNLLRVRLS